MSRSCQHPEHPHLEPPLAVLKLLADLADQRRKRKTFSAHMSTRAWRDEQKAALKAEFPRGAAIFAKIPKGSRRAFYVSLDDQLPLDLRQAARKRAKGAEQFLIPIRLRRAVFELLEARGGAA